MMTAARTEAARILLRGGVPLVEVARVGWEPWGYANGRSLEVVLRKLIQRGDLPEQAPRGLPEFNRAQAVKIAESCRSTVASPTQRLNSNNHAA